MARHNHRLPVLLILLAALALSACAGIGAGQTPAGDGHAGESADMAIPDITPVDLASGEPLRVVATTNIIGDVVTNVGGEHIDLTVLIPQGQDPHGYEPVARDLAAVEGADVIFVNGLDLEEALLGTVESAASGPIVPISAGIDPLVFEGDEHEHEGEEEHQESEQHEEEGHTHTLDPHFWLDPNNVIVWANNAAEVLSAADPAHADAYRANADAYVAQLEQLDADIRAAVKQIPAANRKLITDHEAFGYFADEYGFEQIGTVVPGTSTTAEPSAADLAALVDLIRAQNVPAIFVGTSASGRLHDLSQTVADEVGREVQILPLYVGSLDAPGQPGDTYLGMMRFNLQQIVAGLAR
jgi:ABC-type Zn uptake system ZnuABC Zn-binding protein ZnuA